MKRLLLTALLLFIISAVSQSLIAQNSPDDSGMWLLPQIKGAVHTEMQAKGLRLSSEDFYSADNPSLNEAIVRINIGEGGGGTGSFVSSQGLILTNHHVAYDAIASASTASENYLNEGFFAESQAEEIPAQGYRLYIPIEQTEVTELIKQKLEENFGDDEPSIRNRIIEERLAGDPNFFAEIDDYWSGYRQFMVVYQIINDVRLVHAPPSAIGKFGGNIDNWMWPRHTGDYSFLRAWVAPDGTSAEYNEDNVPFTPNRFLPISTKGFQADDFTMTLGFPGSTYRFESSYAFNYYRYHQIPYIIQAFQAKLDGMEYEAKMDEEIAVETASDRASFANSLKYYQGIIDGFDAYSIIERKKAIEQSFADWVRADENRKSRYGAVLQQLEDGYNIAIGTSDYLYTAYYGIQNSGFIQAASILEPFYNHIEASTYAFAEADKDSIINTLTNFTSSVNLDAEIISLTGILKMLGNMPPKYSYQSLDAIFKGRGKLFEEYVDLYMEDFKEVSPMINMDVLKTLLNTDPAKYAEITPDPLFMIYRELREKFTDNQPKYVSHFSLVEAPQKKYVVGMIEFNNDSTYYPDANFTLRLSGGRIMGYYPEDGVKYLYTTTLDGVLAKEKNEDPFDVPDALQTYVRNATTTGKPISRYLDSNGKLIVNFLSTNDITGGNSGSPVLNANGEMLGIAFDGNIEGVVGDYFYDPELNRTISVDIRYVLFITEELYGLKWLSDEMEIK